MKILNLTMLSLFAIMFFSCSQFEESDLGTSASIVKDCRKECNIIQHPHDPVLSTSNCGDVTLDILEDYFRICVDPELHILEFVGFSLAGEEEYYNNFWSFFESDNCFWFQPHDINPDDIMEQGYRLDLIICDYQYDVEMTSS